LIILIGSCFLSIQLPKRKSRCIYSIAKNKCVIWKASRANAEMEKRRHENHFFLLNRSNCAPFIKDFQCFVNENLFLVNVINEESEVDVCHKTMKLIYTYLKQL
jgi:hypothetical protein